MIITWYKDMIEAVISGIIALAVFVFGYGVLSERVRANKQTSDDRHSFYVKELDALKESNFKTQQGINAILVTLQKIDGDVVHIKEKIVEDKK